VGILFMKDASIKLKVTGIGSLVEYNAQVQSCEIEVSPGDEVDYPTLDGNVARNVGPESYALVITAGQDWASTGLARFLFDNSRATLDFEYQAHGATQVAGATTPIVTGQCKAVPGNYGGEAGSFAEIEVTLPCLTKPLLDVTP
jgi:hypothetical protein